MACTVSVPSSVSLDYASTRLEKPGSLCSTKRTFGVPASAFLPILTASLKRRELSGAEGQAQSSLASRELLDIGQKVSKIRV
jgi:hypothetical protein